MGEQFRFVAAISALLLGGGLGLGHAAAQTTDCDKALAAAPPTVSKAYNYDYSDKQGDPRAKEIALKQIVTVEGEHLASLFDKACANRTVVLFFNGWPIGDVVPMPPVDPALNRLNFKLVSLHHDEGTNNPWLPILGRPTFSGVAVNVSVGFADGYAMKATNAAQARLHLTVLPVCWFLLWAAIFLFMVGGLFVLARRTNVLRDPAPSAPGKRGSYSLARAQGACWFFIIVAAYLFIGIITGDFSNSVNSTALILLGIGAGTVIGSAAIDAQKDTAKDKADTVVAVKKVSAQIAASDAAVKKIDTDAKAAPSDADRSAQETERANQAAALADLNSQLAKLKGQSECFLTDILSDANGVSFHRFQIAAWTLVLGVIFVVEVYQNLAMPTFNTTLMGMLGLSAGTYLGLKIPEATIPAKQ